MTIADWPETLAMAIGTVWLMAGGLSFPGPAALRAGARRVNPPCQRAKAQIPRAHPTVVSSNKWLG